MKTAIKIGIICMVILMMIPSCSKKNGKVNKKLETKSIMIQGTFGYDKAFLKKHYNNTITLESKDGSSAIILSPELQGRVMTSTLNGNKGKSFGWLNYDLIKSQKTEEHFNPTGGEERFWIGPEGGQYSIYFAPGSSFEFENWYVPSAIDTEPFDIVSRNARIVKFKKEINLVNYSGTRFNIDVEREVSLLTDLQITELLGLENDDFFAVAYETQNSIKNIGAQNWNKSSGLLSVWLLSMMTPSPEVTVIIPIKEGKEDELGVKVNDNYFGKVSGDRLKIIDKTVFFKADGKSRGKIGFTPLRSTRFMGSYDAIHKVLTILEISKPNSSDSYVNSAWELQEDPFSGDVLNSYNDGPLEDGSQMGPFYELESSSPALALASQESYKHTQRIYHFKAENDVLNAIAIKILNVSIDEINAVFKK